MMQLTISEGTDPSESSVILAPNADTVVDLGTKDETEVLKAFFRYFPAIPSGIIPPCLRYISPDRRTIVYEQAPRYVDIPVIWQHMEKIENSAGGSGAFTQQRYVLPMPWLIYCATLSPLGEPTNIYVFVVKGSMSSTEEVAIYRFPFLNFYDDSRLCRAPEEMAVRCSLADSIEQIYSAVWLTGFNNDLAHHMASVIGNGAVSAIAGVTSPQDILRKWSRLSLADIVSSEWPVAKWKSLTHFLKSGALQKTAAEAVDLKQFFLSRVTAAYQSV